MITPHNIKGLIFFPCNSLIRDVANMVGTRFQHRGVKNLT